MNSIAAHHPTAEKKETPVAVIVTILLFVLSLLGSGFTAYTHNDKALGERITAVETQQKNDGGRLDRIEAKIDRILERMK